MPPQSSKYQACGRLPGLACERPVCTICRPEDPRIILMSCMILIFRELRLKPGCGSMYTVCSMMLAQVFKALQMSHGRDEVHWGCALHLINSLFINSGWLPNFSAPSIWVWAKFILRQASTNPQWLWKISAGPRMPRLDLESAAESIDHQSAMLLQLKLIGSWSMCRQAQ